MAKLTGDTFDHPLQARHEKQGEIAETKVFQARKGLKHQKEGPEKTSFVVYGTLHVPIHHVPSNFQKFTSASYVWR